jgi:hypothetical protein
VEFSQAEFQPKEAAVCNANAQSQCDLAIAAIVFQTGAQP